VRQRAPNDSPTIPGNFRFTSADLVVAAVLLSLSAYLLIGGMVTSWATGPGLMNAGGVAVGRDFTMFWSASLLALGENAASVYDFQLIREVQGSLTGVPNPTYPGWLYPPTGLLFVAPVSLLPYKVSLVVWTLAGVCALGAVLWGVLRRPLAVVALLLFPAVGLCLINGQSSVFLAALLGGGLVLLDRRPWLAGFLLGIATVKPQLILLVAPCLLVGRHWRALGGLTVTLAGLVVVSLAVFGGAAWEGWLNNVVGAVDILVQVGPLEKMQSVLVAASLAGLDRGAAMALQAAVAALMLVVVGWLWYKRFPIEIRGSALLLAAPLATPYSFDYDLAVLTVALAWMALEIGRRGWLRGERVLAVLLWISPIAGWFIAVGTGIILTPLVLLACLWRVVRTAQNEIALP